jgi:flagellar protein FlgJ
MEGISEQGTRYRGGGEEPTARTLREATQEFESLYVTQILQAMRRTVPESGLMAASSGQRLFREMLDEEFAREIAHSGGLGIGEMLYHQLSGER